jgi:hypothetical protein
MGKQDWDVVAAASRWSTQYQHILRDSHWAFGDPNSFTTYATAAWQPSDSRQGIMLLRNPQLQPGETKDFTLGDALELPAAERDSIFRAEVVVSLSEDDRGKELGSKAESSRDCPFASGSWEMAGWESLHASLRSGEVLVLLLTPTGKTRSEVRSAALELQPVLPLLLAFLVAFIFEVPVWQLGV